MSADTDRDLPRAFWADPITPSTKALEVQALSEAQREYAEWAPTFLLLGWNIDTAMQTFVNTHSAALGKQLRTYEDVVNHIRSGAGAPEAQSVPEADTDEDAVKAAAKQALRDRRAAKHARTEQARQDWRKAVADRKLALANWDAYVAQLHAKFVSVRDERD